MARGQKQAYPNNVDVTWVRASGAGDSDPASSIEAFYRERADSHRMDVHTTAGYPYVEQALRQRFGLNGVPVEFHHSGIIPLGAFAGPSSLPPPRE